MKKAIIPVILLVTLTLLAACTDSKVTKKETINFQKPLVEKKNIKPQEIILSDINLQQYKHFFEEDYFPIKDSTPTGYIVSSVKGLNVITDLEKIYVIPSNKKTFRKGTYLISSVDKTIYSPTDSKKVIGKLLNPTGEAVWVKNTGNLAVLEVTKIFEEIFSGNLLIPMKDVVSPLPEYAFKTTRLIKGKVIYILNDKFVASQYSSIMLNIGKNDGVKNGMLIYINAEDMQKTNPIEPTSKIKIPGRIVAKAVIYRTTKALSIALIINSKEEVLEGYSVTTNEN